MLLTVVVSIVLIAYITEALLDHLNQSTAGNALDPSVAGLYDLSERKRSIAYSAEKTRFGFYSSTFSTIVMILALCYGWFAALDSWVRDRFDNQIVVSLVFIASLSVISWWLNLPFQLYSIFGIEARYGFNKITPKTFIVDTMKGTVLGTLIGGALLTAVLWIYQELGGRFWIFAWALVSGFSLIMFMFGTSLILPLFNKLTPVAAGELRTASKYINVSTYDLNLLPIEGRSIFDADSISETLDGEVFHPYVGHIMNKQSDLYNNFVPDRLDKGDERYYPLNTGSYLLCVSTTRNEPLDYEVAFVVEFPTTTLDIMLEDYAYSLYEDTAESYVVADTVSDYVENDLHVHSLSDWDAAWRREHQQGLPFPATLVPLATQP